MNVNARLITITNIDVIDILMDGLIQTVKLIEEKKVSSIYLALDGDFCEPTRNNANEIISKAIQWALIERKDVST